MSLSYRLMLKKTNFIIFSFSKKRIVNTIDVVIDNQPVSRVSYTKFLDVIYFKFIYL